MPYETISLEKRGAIAYLTLRRPQAGNALNAPMATELVHACQALNQDEGMHAVVLNAAGDSFCTGGEPQGLEAAGEATRAIAGIERATIAAIGGDCLAEGLELALACDIRVASRGARLGLPQVSLGLVPGGGGTQRLPRLVGRGKAMEMLLGAEPIDADEALRVGLVSRVVPPEELAAQVDEIAGQIASRGPIAVRFTKEAVNKGLDLTLGQGMRLEGDLYFLIQTTEDRMEGIRAFMEKRPPQFKGE